MNWRVCWSSLSPWSLPQHLYFNLSATAPCLFFSRNCHNNLSTKAGKFISDLKMMYQIPILYCIKVQETCFVPRVICLCSCLFPILFNWYVSLYDVFINSEIYHTFWYATISRKQMKVLHTRKTGAIYITPLPHHNNGHLPATATVTINIYYIRKQTMWKLIAFKKCHCRGIFSDNSFSRIIVFVLYVSIGLPKPFQSGLRF